MELRCVSFMMSFGFFLIIAGHADCTCPSLQYIVIGTTGVIQCSFEEGFFGVLWYNSTETLHQEAILTSRESEKSGVGYNAEEYDIYPNGSLIIYNVSKHHESNYTVILLKTTTDLSVDFIINVLVNAETFIPYTRIHQCSDSIKVCLQQWDKNSEIMCYVQDARLMVPLQWMVRTISGDRNISSQLSVTNRTSYFTSVVTTTNPFLFSSFLVLLVCSADDPMGLLTRTQSTVLIFNDNFNPTSENVITKYLQIGSNMRLDCSDNEFSFILWHVKMTLEDRPTPVVYAVVTEDVFSHIYDDDFTLQNDSSLVIHNFGAKHEGFYSCISGDGTMDDITVYNVIAFALPVPAYPVIEGCNHEQYCVLEVQREGSLTCTLRGISPQLQLDMKALFHQSPNVIEFFDKQLVSHNNGGAFDVSLILKYRVKETEEHRVTISCLVVGAEIDVLNLSTKFDLLFMTVESEELPPSMGHTWIFVPITVVICLMVLCGIIFIQVFRKRQCINRYSTNDSIAHEGNNSRGPTVNEAEALPMMEQLTTLEKQRLFISQLKSKYEDLYDAVQPIPYIRDRLYCVDRVFVEGGIEFLVSIDTIGGHGTWQTLDTYQDIFNDTRVKSVRRILEGEPGYGKSTLTLQLAYDWCNEIPASLLCNVDILILLRLRQLGGVTSIYKAIKQFILPIDSLLSENDIKTILSNSSSVVVVLDGFDEYPDQDKGNKSDVINIIMKKMFQKVEVILTTRSSFLPKDYPPQTKRVKLTGFDDTARDQYIQKAVVGNDKEAAEKIKKRLKDNTVLAGLCQVPLFFVLFAHMSHESKHFQKFNSVTSFFRYMVSCFHSHMKNKFKDENVKNFDLFETEHQELDKIAFEGLAGKEQQIVWKKEELCNKLGLDFYNQYVSIGILIEEEVLAITDKPSALITEHVQYYTEVRFYHKLFCEWYAAHHLAEYASKEDVAFNLNSTDEPFLRLQPDIKSNAWNTDPFLRHLDPIDVQFLYRFACGLNPVASKKIIEYLRKSKEGEKFAILCILEQEGNVEHLLETVRQLCSSGVLIASDHNLLLQRSTIQLLEIAASNEIPISSVGLLNCFQSVDMKEECLCLSSGLQLPRLDTLKELEIVFTRRTDLRDHAGDILDYSAKCAALKTLKFHAFDPVLLPQSFDNKDVLARLYRKNCKVEWTFGNPLTFLYGNWKLNLQSGKWENEKGEEMTDQDYQKVVDLCRRRGIIKCNKRPNLLQ